MTRKLMIIVSDLRRIVRMINSDEYDVKSLTEEINYIIAKILDICQMQ